jgi:hypothetical protein
MNVLWPQQIAYLFPGTPLHNGWLAVSTPPSLLLDARTLTLNVQCIVGSATLLGQIAGAGLVQYIPRSRIILITSCMSLLAFSAAMVSIRPDDEAKGIAILFVACFSVGVIESCSLALAPLACPTEDIGVATGALGSIRSGGASVALAIYTTVLTNKLTEFIPEYVSAAALSAGLPQSSLASLFENLPAGTLNLVPGIDANIIGAVSVANAAAAADAFK